VPALAVATGGAASCAAASSRKGNAVTSDGFLHRYFLNNGHKMLHKWMHYFDIYERHLERFRNRPVTMLEIGVAGGGSLAMWREYLGPQARIIGLDINPACKAHEAEGIEIHIGSQDDPALLDRILARHPAIVIDDGSHVMRHLLASFRHLYPRLSPTGVYLLEDLHTCYWDRYEGGLKRPGTFIEYAKDLIDELNAGHTLGAVPVSDFTASTFSITCYDSIIAFERRPQGRRRALITLPMERPV
jgi:cephalosporin hydroxylase